MLIYYAQKVTRYNASKNQRFCIIIIHHINLHPIQRSIPDDLPISPFADIGFEPFLGRSQIFSLGDLEKANKSLVVWVGENKSLESLSKQQLGQIYLNMSKHYLNIGFS